MMRLSTPRLMEEASQKVHAIVGVLLLLNVGISHAREALLELNTDSWRTRAANFRSKLEMVLPGLVKLTSCRMMLAGHFTCQAKLVPSLFVSIQTLHGTLSRGICVAYIRYSLVDNICKVC